MIISMNWLADYVQLTGASSPAVSLADMLAERLLMSGLNHESTRAIGDDTAVEIEVTSNRPDCLGHIGVAREAAVLFSRPLHIPDPRPLEAGGIAAESIAVEIRSPECCPFYLARVIRGVHVGPSPSWLVERLATVGVESVNNVVDITNYVMLECGQPLHAFDLQKICGGQIIVRQAEAGELFVAINHKTYSLTSAMCVIADNEGAVALAGVMGGAKSEVSESTVDILLESAQFAPLSVRAAARGLLLGSGSSYRFERSPDPAAVEWASRRAAAMILDTAGGVLERGVVEAGTLACSPVAIDLRHARVAQVLGIDIPQPRQRSILTALGFAGVAAAGPMAAGNAPSDRSRWQSPTWRRDVSREIDLVEEIGRIEGYEQVPEDESISAQSVELSAREQAVRIASSVLVSAGMCEAITRSVVNEHMEATRSPWSDGMPLSIAPALVRGADRLRRTLVPSLLEARAGTLAVGAPHGELFEVAHAYLSRADIELPLSKPRAVRANARTPEDSILEEPLLVSLVTGGEFASAKGLAEAILLRLGIGGDRQPPAVSVCVEFRPLELDLFAPGRAAEILLHRHAQSDERIGVVGEIAPVVLKRFGLEGPVTAAELRLDRLDWAVGVDRVLQQPSDFPAIQRDINLVVDIAVPWSNIVAAIYSVSHQATGLGHTGNDNILEECRLVQVWKDEARLGTGKKSVVVSLRLRSHAGTLSGEEAHRVIESIVVACGQRVGATLRS